MMKDEMGRMRDKLERGARLRLGSGPLTLSAAPPPAIIRDVNGGANHR